MIGMDKRSSPMTLKPTENQDDSSSSSQTDEIMDETNKSVKEQEDIH
jgi:hypothetical protein